MSLRTKFTIILNCLILLSIGGVSIYLLFTERQNLELETIRKQKTIVIEVAQIVRESLIAQDDLLLMNYISIVKKNNPAILFIEVSDTSGKIIGHTDFNQLKKKNENVSNHPDAMTFGTKILAEGAEAISKGNLDHRVEIKSNDELGMLGKQFNEMGDKLNELDQMKQDFVSSVTHELRSPLGAIESYIKMMKKTAESDENIRAKWGECLDRVYSNTMRLSRFINDLLDIAKIERGKMEIKQVPVNFYEIANEIIDFLKPKADEKSISLFTDIPAGLPLVFADPERIRQILINLVSNAVKFTRENGSVSLSVVSGKKIDNMITFVVSDTGIGIAAESKNKIFTKFSQVHSAKNEMSVKGTGLGLAIVKALVEGHGGKVWFESEPDKGTKFYFTLPIVANS